MLLGLILLIITLAGSFLFGVKPAWFPLPITIEALAYDRQFTWTLWITGVIFITAQVLLAWTILRGEKTFAASSKARTGRLEWAWTAAAATLFITLSVTGSRGWAKIPRGSAG